jgi:hypothetical protein
MRTLMLTAAFCCAVIVAGTGCGGDDKPTAPPAEATVQTPAVPQNKPMTLTGCLRAGEATDTFVLTTAQTRDSAETATYHLTGVQGVNLRDHIGHQVEVNGVVRSEQQMASASPSREADRKATGTTGTPTVQTRTELQVRQMEVKSIKPTGQKCE